MWKYEKAEMEIVKFEADDVIRTSSLTENGTIEDEGTGTPFVPRIQ